MPWSVQRSSDCPDDKPWAVVNDDSGATEGCHASEEDAKTQQAALYANTQEEGRSEDLVPDGQPEMRSVPFTDVDAAADGGSFEGYAAVFDIEADLGDFTESVSRGAFRRSLATGDNVPMLYDHNPSLPILATTKSGTLQLQEDAKGLRVKADVAKHFMGDAVRELVKRGDIAGMSFGFVAGRGNSRVESRSGKPHRTLIGFKKLLDVSPTWHEAYSGTSAEIRSLMAVGMADSAHQMAEPAGEEQQVLSGAYQQPEDGAPPPQVDTDDGEEEARSGAAGISPEAARRRLRAMAITIPKEFRR